MANWTVTLKSLRKAGACIGGYNKLVCHISGKSFNPERETYMRFKHDEPISIKTILESNGLEDALWATRCVAGADRDLRLFAVWHARQVQHLMADARSIAAIDVAERYANGEATGKELAAAGAAAWDAAWAARAAGAAARDAAWAARNAAVAAAWDAARDASWAAAWAAALAAAGDADRAARAAQHEMFVRMLDGTAPWQAKD